MTDPLQLDHPIVLVHGLGARSAYGPVEYFFGLPKLLRNAGNRLLIANLTAWQTIEHRAEQLKKQVERAFPDEKVNLLCHSMGGLDARYLASQLDFSDRIASITTIGTPHHGTSAIRLAQGLVPNAALSWADRFLGLMGSTGRALRQVSREYCQGEFARLTPNMPGIAYFSAASAIRNPFVLRSLPIFWVPFKFLEKVEGDNDGFVSVDSSQWGTHICTYDGDHYAQIGQFLGRSRGLDYVDFYHTIFRRLKREGF